MPTVTTTATRVQLNTANKPAFIYADINNTDYILFASNQDDFTSGNYAVLYPDRALAIPKNSGTFYLQANSGTQTYRLLDLKSLNSEQAPIYSNGAASVPLILDGNSNTQITRQSVWKSVTSAAATQNQIVITTYNIKSIAVTVSTDDTNFGTASMTYAVDVSLDNNSWTALVTATALAIGKTQQSFVFNDANLVATTSQGNTQPALFPYIRFTVSAASATKHSTILYSGK